jgi:4-hydroxybenzoate polyprenyltransferase/phosphoserine phosphatase
VPLCVDLDGTLIKTDLLWESFIRLLKKDPLAALCAPFWLLRGRAHLKQNIAARVEIDPTRLPYCQALVDFLRAEKAAGRQIILATASDARLARPVARHLGVFSEVIASDGRTNLRGTSKLQALEERFGAKGFDYAGNSSPDLSVWKRARQAIVVNASASLARRAREVTEIQCVFNSAKPRLKAVVRALRPHQWVKNLIIFVPLFTAHELRNTPLVLKGVLAFVVFSLCASGIYVLNDLLDLDADRHHPTKRLRPFAAGDLPLPWGFALIAGLLAASFALAAPLSLRFFGVLVTYLALTTSYSWRVKQVPLLDVFFLAGLYTIRLVAGHEATRIPYSTWLLMFSMFIFLSLALVKRFRELSALRQQRLHESKGRGYTAADLEIVAMLGSVSGYLSALVLALYVNSQEVANPVLYKHPRLLLLICPLFLYWTSRVWMIAHRGQMHDDPIVFALKDRPSYFIGALTLAIVWLAAGH